MLKNSIQQIGLGQRLSNEFIIFKNPHLLGVFFYFYIMLTKNNIFLILLGFTFFIPSFGAIDLVAPKTLFLSIINLIFLFISKKEVESLLKNPELIFKCYFLIFVLSIISVFSSLNIPETIIYSLQFFVFFSTLISFYIIFINSAAIFFIFPFFLFCVTFFEIVYLIDDLFLLGFNFNTRFSGSGSFSNINISSFSLLFKIPFIVLLFDQTKSKLLKPLIVIVLFLSVFFILAQASRAAIIILIGFLFFYFAYLLINKLFKFQVVILFISFLLFSGISSFQSNDNLIISRLESVSSNFADDSSITYRLNLYKGAISSFFDHPFLGVGGGNYKLTSISYSKDYINGYVIPYHTHNDFLEILTELGVFGFVIYSSIFIILFFYLFKIILDSSSHFNVWISFTSLLSLSSFFIDSLFNFPASRAVQQILFMSLIAFVVILFKNHKTQND